jgi:hypothetical protein
MLGNPAVGIDLHQGLHLRNFTEASNNLRDDKTACPQAELLRTLLADAAFGRPIQTGDCHLVDRQLPDAVDSRCRTEQRVANGCLLTVFRAASPGDVPLLRGGTTDGVFVSAWRGDILYGSNDAVDGKYILAYAQAPESARADHTNAPRRMLLWHANYHPDGGQLFFPQQRQPFYVPLALPGDDVTPERFVCFRFDGRQGLYIHPNI